MATIKPVSFNRLPEIDENDGKVILHDGSQLGRSTKELGEIIDDRLRTGLEDGKQYAMTTSGWKDVVIPEVDFTPYAYSAGLEADKQFVMTDNGWAEVDLSPYALSADVDSKAEEISAWANETFLTGVDLSDYALSADVDIKADEIFEWANNTFVTSANLEDDTQYVMTTSGWGEVTIPEQVQSDWEEDDPESPAYILNKPVSAEIIGDDKTVKLIPGEDNQYTVSALYEGKYVPLSAMQCTIGINNTNTNQGVSFTQGFSNTVQNDNAFAQGTSNTVSQQSMAQGIANSAYNNSFAQGGGAYANTFSFAQGNGISANNTAMVQGRNSYSDTESLAVGENVSAVCYSLAVGNGNSAFQGSIAVGLNNTSKRNGFTQGYGNSALGEYSVAIGLQNSATSNCTFATGRENSAAGEDAIAMGQKNYASSRYTFAVGLGNSAIEGHAIALGQNNIVSGEFGVALSQLNSAFGNNAIVAGYKNFSKGHQSVALGYLNSVSGDDGVAIGYNNKAYKVGSVAIGYSNTSKGNYSFAEGFSNYAEGEAAHVEGAYSQATGSYSHAEGYQTSAKGNGSHAEGLYTFAADIADHVEGIGSYIEQGGCNHVEGFQYHTYITNGPASNFYGTNKVKFNNAPSIATNGSEINGSLYEFVNAFKDRFIVSCDYVSSTEYHYVNRSFFKPKLYKIIDVSLIEETNQLEITIDGIIDCQLGGAVYLWGPTSISIINSTGGMLNPGQVIDTFTINGLSFPGNSLENVRPDNCFLKISITYTPVGTSEAISFHRIIKPTSITYNSTTNEYTFECDESIELPTDAQAGSYSLSVCLLNSVYYGCNHIEGRDNVIKSSECSHIEGLGNYIQGSYAHAEGCSTSALREGSHAEGQQTKAAGSYAHSEGYNTYANSDYSHAEGYYTSAFGGNSHSEGDATLANNGNTHSEGWHTSAMGNCSHVEGETCLASGSYSHAQNYRTSAIGDASMTIGSGTVAGSKSMFAMGNYNKTTADVAFVIGNGTTDSNRSDAFIVNWNGVASATNLQTSAGYVVTDVMLTSSYSLNESVDVEDDVHFVTNGVADLTPLYTYIKSLEDRIAALESAQGGDGFTVNGVQPTVNGNTITVGE